MRGKDAVVTLAAQYLEPGPATAEISPQQTRTRLRDALERLPISHVLLGWNLPAPLVNVCREETARAGSELFLWHPLLTGDGDLFPHRRWRTVGLSGETVRGFRGLPEFTFMCANRPAVRAGVLKHLRQILRRGGYDGVFLDRIRFPSPAADPSRWLACFCADCQREAHAVGLDLVSVRQNVLRLLAASGGARSLVLSLLGAGNSSLTETDDSPLRAFLDFREQYTSRLVNDAIDIIHAEGLGVGLDAFSPCLTRMVGQHLAKLEAGLHATRDWVKVMTYGHALGPAGLPFELLAMADWLTETCATPESLALDWLAQAAGFPLPRKREELRESGLSPAALGAEIRRARSAGVKHLLAGIELVEIRGVTRLNNAQIRADLHAIKTAGADGLVLSWDLWHIPLERLDLVASEWT